MSSEHHENFICPYCGQTNELLIDVTGGPSQQFVVDCEVCCAPITVRLKMHGDELMAIDIRKENE